MKHAHFCIRCIKCQATTSKAYAYKHEGMCKACATGVITSDRPTREQRILDHGYQAYAREEGHYDQGDF